MALLEQVGRLLQPWADLYGGSAAVSSAVEFLHLGSLLAAGGLALAFDRTALRVADGHSAGRGVFAAELSAVHRPVLIGLALVVLSGLALTAADAEVLLAAPVYWVKMGVFALLLVNGAGVRRVGRRLEADPRDAHQWRRLRRGSVRSMGLWMLAMLLGVLLTGA